MRRGVILALCGILFFSIIVGYKYWKYPYCDVERLICYKGNLTQIDDGYDYFRSAPKYYMLLKVEDGTTFYIHPLLLGKVDQDLLEQSLYKPITVRYDPSTDKSAYGAFRVLSIADSSKEILSHEDANRVFKEQHLIGIVTGVFVLIPTELVAFWLISDVKRKKSKKQTKNTKI